MENLYLIRKGRPIHFELPSPWRLLSFAAFPDQDRDLSVQGKGHRVAGPAVNGVLFAVGSTCFVLGPIPAYASLVGPLGTTVTFFVGSLVFTSAAYLSYLQVVREAEQWKNRSEGLPVQTAYEALVLASIIEKETAVPEERKAIAGVFVRRLQKGMRLQTDPTVIYGLGESFDGNLRRRDLRSDSPYNTYRIKGLPPTPIAMPSLAAIEAALHPAPGKALYFVARGDGSHEFSDTLEEHNEAVIKYQLGGKRRPFSSSK